MHTVSVVVVELLDFTTLNIYMTEVSCEWCSSFCVTLDHITDWNCSSTIKSWMLQIASSESVNLAESLVFLCFWSELFPGTFETLES